MRFSVISRVVPLPVKRRVRRAARSVAAVRTTRAWPWIRPVYRVARPVLNIDRILGRGDSYSYWRMHNRVHRVRRRLLTLGLTEPALRDLRELTAPGEDEFVRRLAAWELAQWYANQHTEAGAREALAQLPLAAAGEIDPHRLRRLAVVEAECHRRLHDTAAAARVLATAMSWGTDANLLLAQANLVDDGADRVAMLNRALATSRIPPVSLDPASGRPALDSLSCPAAGPPRRRPGGRQPLVTVIMPVRDAADTVATALTSVLAQTWHHLEVLVVDDGSTDGTAEVVRSYARRDDRVRLFATGSGAGPYVARNLALSRASGEFVTCHDADDWSHPERIARQVRHLLRHRTVIGNTSQQVRTTSELRFCRRGQPGTYIFRNLSSFLFRRAVVMERIGYWDSVRFGADEEYVQRVLAAFGPHAVADLATGPLCLQRQREGSLTTDPHFGYAGFLYGARWDYQESYRQHHQRATTLRYEFPQPARPFPVPAPMLPTPRPVAPTRRHFDVVIASDFRMLGGSTQSNIEEITAQCRAGLRTGLVQLARYGVDPMRSVLPRLRGLVDGDRVQMLVHGEQVSCDLLIVRYPPVLQEWQRYVPDVRAGEIRVVVNQPPMSDYGPDAVLRYHIPRCAAHLRRYFGRDATWHPIGPLVRQALYEHHADELSAIDLADWDWVNVIDVDGWRREQHRPRRECPRIGRHSRDHPHKWPATTAELLAAYPDSPHYQVWILGGAQAPRELLGYWPQHWRAWRFGERAPREFLSELDLFVYFTHPDWVESFGRVVLEAMAVGVPAVLPHAYRDLFGDAAVYAKPSEVTDTVDRLVADPEAYHRQVEAARARVEARFGYSMHLRRVRELTGRD